MEEKNNHQKAKKIENVDMMKNPRRMGAKIKNQAEEQCHLDDINTACHNQYKEQSSCAERFETFHKDVRSGFQCTRLGW